MKSMLLKKVADKTLKMGVIGLGYVGLPLAVEKARAGFDVTGFDIQNSRVNMVNEGCNYIGDVVDKDLTDLVKSGKLRATTDFSFIKDMDFVAICVPTPLDNYKQPDTSYISLSAKEIAKYLKKQTIVVLESTTYPGTTEELLLPILEQSGLRCGVDFYLGFSPERVDPGNAQYKTKNTPKVVGGVGKDATEVIATVYETVLESEIFRVSSPKIAEMEKILENTYRNVNIGLANEMAVICNRMGINVWEVIEAAKTKPYGFQVFYPGPGLGGHCIPLDPFYLSWKAREYNYHMKLIETAGEINDHMPEFVIERCYKILNKHQKSMNGAKVLILGVAYKQDIDDYRESPALAVIDNFEKEGAIISYYDPYVKSYEHNGTKRNSIGSLENLSKYDIAVVTTAHTTVDYEIIANAGIPVFDCKNAMKNVQNRGSIELL